jgi:hypothetical protein
VTTESDKLEQANAIRALLRSPLLGREHPAFETVGIHQQDLRRWFRSTTGWDLLVDTRRGLARLWKVPAPRALPRPLLSDRAEPRPFDRRRYELFCVAAAALAHFPRRQVSLQDLSGRIVTLTEDDDLGVYDPERREDRAALIDVLTRLCLFGVIVVLDAQGNYERQRDSNALYSIDEGRLAALLPGEPATTKPDEALRHSLARKLFDDPVLYHEDLDDSEQECLRQSARWFRQRFADAGLLLEQRFHGWCAIDVTGETSDSRFPQLTAHVHQAALLIISRLEPSDGMTWVSEHRLRTELDQVLAEYPTWAKRYRKDRGIEQLVADVVTVLRSLDLVRADAVGLELRPAAGRFRNVALPSESS